ncbi:hypothetical protein [Streptomyces sp. MMS20-AI2-20]
MAEAARKAVALARRWAEEDTEDAAPGTEDAAPDTPSGGAEPDTRTDAG